ncbi:acetylcholine receptor subunit alpha-type acr-16-like [Culicoides brevitarsis]|uniref:acetylcholine receptor subunit alpha-type acr-16-like n=1 Tax=Culicoides brevitarsis TaxID=469753 RepID=UPI00307B277D
MILFALLLVSTKFFSVSAVNCGTHPSTVEAHLRQTLLCHYDPTEKPRFNWREPVQVEQLDLSIIAFEFFETGHWSSKRSKLSLYCWIPMQWIDENLRWNPVEWENTKKVHVSSKEIWMPDVALHNSDNGMSILRHKETNCEVGSDGAVFCVLPVSFEVMCKGDYQRWPYVDQRCKFYFGSWMSAGDYITYKNGSFETTYDEDEQHENSKWKITKATTRMVNVKVGEKQFPSFILDMTLSPRSIEYEICLYPMCLFITIANLIVFCINPERQARFSIIFLSIFLHYLIVNYFLWYLPGVGDVVPDVVHFFKNSMIVTIIALLETVVVRALLAETLPIHKSLENFVIKLNTHEKANIIFVEFMPGSGVVEQNLSLQDAIKTKNESKEDKISFLLVTFIDRLLLVMIFLMYIVYFGVLTYDWMLEVTK